MKEDVPRQAHPHLLSMRVLTDDPNPDSFFASGAAASGIPSARGFPTAG